MKISLVDVYGPTHFHLSSEPPWPLGLRRSFKAFLYFAATQDDRLVLKTNPNNIWFSLKSKKKH